MNTARQHRTSRFDGRGYRTRHGRTLVYSVSGTGRFPTRLLDQEAASPWTESDWEAIRGGPRINERTGRPDLVTVFISGQRCTPKKWESVGWTVSRIAEEFVLGEASHA